MAHRGGEILLLAPSFPSWHLLETGSAYDSDPTVHFSVGESAGCSFDGFRPRLDASAARLPELWNPVNKKKVSTVSFQVTYPSADLLRDLGIVTGGQRHDHQNIRKALLL